MTAISIIDSRVHASELAIDRLLAGELGDRDAAALEHHAAACTRCEAALADARALQRQFAATAPRLFVPQRRRWPVVAAATALAAACALFALHPRAPAGVDGTRAKGTAIVGFFVSHAGHVRRGATREPVMPGDRVELFTTTAEPVWFAAISSDGSVYAEPHRVDAGREQILPTAIELDGALGEESITGVFCAEPFDVHAPPADCTVDHFTLVKVPR